MYPCNGFYLAEILAVVAVEDFGVAHPNHVDQSDGGGSLTQESALSGHASPYPVRPVNQALAIAQKYQPKK